MYDLCVIGAGPAGIILALEFVKVNPDQTVVIIEFGRPGNEGPNKLDDSIKVDNLMNHHEPYDTTVKGLGGTSATWGGRCVNYDRIDFLQREIIGDNCTWSEDIIEEYKPFLPAAATYFECGDPLFSTQEIEGFKDGHIAENFQNGPVTDHVVERWSMPTRFGARYGDELLAHDRIEVMQGFECRDFSPVDAVGNIRNLLIRDTNSGEEQTISAKCFVLSAGAQETTRILLRNAPGVFGNLPGTPSALGKYYQSHLSGKIASVKFYGDPRKTEFELLRNEDGTFIRRRFQFSDEFLLKNNLLNTAIWLDNPHYHDPSHQSGALSFMYLAMITPILGKRLAPPSIAHSITKGVVRDVWPHVFNVLRDLPGSLIKPAKLFYKRYLLKRKLPGIFLYQQKNIYALHFHSEQIPSEVNRMELGEDGEQLEISYTLLDDDVSSIIQLHEELDKWLRQCNCGELIYWYAPEERATVIRKNSIDGIHQVGTTRIAESHERGVVDKNLKVFGTENLFVCSSSVFPTSGQANPTFLLGTFAARLAHHLKEKLEHKQLNSFTPVVN